MSDGEAAVLEGVIVGGGLLLALVNCAKGKYWFGLLFLVWPVVAIGAVRLAKPDSPWARRFYSRERMQDAIDRFPGNAEDVVLDPQERNAPPVGRWLGALATAIAAAIAARHGL